MKRRLLVGSALGMLMAAAPAFAGTNAIPALDRQQSAPALQLAQDETAPAEGLLPKKKHPKQGGEQQPAAQGKAAPQALQPAEQPLPKRGKQAAQQQLAPSAEPAPQPLQQAEQPLPKKRKQPAPSAEPAPQPVQQTEQPLPKKRKQVAQQQPAPTAEPAPQPVQQAEQPLPKKRKQAAQQQPSPTAEPAQQPAQQAEQPLPRKGKQNAAAQPPLPVKPGQKPEQQAGQPLPPKHGKQAPTQAQGGGRAVQPGEVAPVEPSQQAEQLKPKKGNQTGTELPAAGEGQAATAPKAKGAEQPGQQAEGVPGKKRKPTATEPEVQTGQQVAPAPRPKPEVQPNLPAQEVPGAQTAEQPATSKPKNQAAGAAVPQAPAATTGTPAKRPVAPGTGTAQAQPQNAAPVLDSAKEEEPDQTKTGSAPARPRKPVAPAAPPPTDDSAAQAEMRPEKVETVTAERGRRISEAPPPVPLAENRPQGVDVLREIGDRVLVEINNQVMVESSDRPRLEHGARDVYYEDLGNGRTRETVLREDGAQVVTVRNQYGDIVRRSRITEDGREYVLAYVDDRDYQRLDDWRDPGEDLPPLQLDVPVDQYVLDADNVDDPDTYYQFLERPPVERVERLYSVDEVKRSARIRDKLPRIELDTITFEFGSASIGDDQVRKLQGVAEAMDRLLKKNPAESFLIEGHTDAVGTDEANLALSDKRAEAVAQALTNVFGIPPENLATQGYGERYLKVKSDEPEQLNRRVVMRRITPLVAPVASAQ